MNKNLLRQAQQLQARLLQAQQELPNLVAEATAGGGAISVIASGDQKIRSIKIQKDVVSPDDVETLEDLVLAAVNDALEKSKEAASKHMGSITGGMGLPPGLL